MSEKWIEEEIEKLLDAGHQVVEGNLLDQPCPSCGAPLARFNFGWTGKLTEYRCQKGCWAQDISELWNEALHAVDAGKKETIQWCQKIYLPWYDNVCYQKIVEFVREHTRYLTRGGRGINPDFHLRGLITHLEYDNFPDEFIEHQIDLCKQREDKDTIKYWEDLQNFFHWARNESWFKFPYWWSWKDMAKSLYSNSKYELS